MSGWLLGCLVIAVGSLVPALVIASRGPALQRLVGLQLSAAAATALLMGFGQEVGQSSYLIVPLVLVVVSFAGTMVFARLFGHRG